MGAWHSAFAADGPYGEDVEVLCVYLRRVITEEKDIDKAVSVVGWLMWLVSEDSLHRDPMENQSPPSGQGEQGVVTWQDAIQTMQQSVQAALGVRGLPPVDFD
jgi:DNA repair protein REV1